MAIDHRRRQDRDFDHLGLRRRLFPLSAAHAGILDDLRHADAARRGADLPDLSRSWRISGCSTPMLGPDVPLIASATATLLFRQFFMTIPDELVEASKIDGAGPDPLLHRYRVLPLSSRTNIAALFVILFIYGWNQYLWPLLITKSEGHMETIVIGIKKMIVTSDAQTDWQIGHGDGDAGDAAARRRRPADAALVRQGPRREREMKLRSMAEVNPQRRRSARAFGDVARDPRRRLRPSPTASSWCIARALGLREIDAAAHRRGARGTQTSGDIEIGGTASSTTVEPKDRNIAMVFQNYALYPHMSVYDNMAYGLRSARHEPSPRSSVRVKKAASDPRARQAARPQAAPALRRPAPARRDGPRHRAQPEGLPVRRAAVEPRRQAARADAPSRSSALHQTPSHVTSVYVTHDQVEAMTHGRPADRHEQAGNRRAHRHAPSTIYARNRRRVFVAGFIGSPAMNLVPVDAKSTATACAADRRARPQASARA